MFNVFLNTPCLVLNLIFSKLQCKQNSALHLKSQSLSGGSLQCQLGSCRLSAGIEARSPSLPTLCGSQENMGDIASSLTGEHLLFADLFLVLRDQSYM